MFIFLCLVTFAEITKLEKDCSWYEEYRLTCGRGYIMIQANKQVDIIASKLNN